LVRVVSRGGTYLLNVGPDGRGRIPPEIATILGEVGGWVRAHEATIQGVEPTPLGPLPWGECTARGNTLYLHVLHWPRDGRLIVPGISSAVRRACMFEGGQRIGFKRIDGAVVLALPKVRPEALIPVVMLELEGPLAANREQVALNDCINTLEPGLARLSGCEIKKVSWMEKFGDWKSAECVGGWNGGEGSATWEFRTVEPSRFYLNVDYTAPAEEDFAEWRVTMDGRPLTFPLLDTGERANRPSLNQPLPRFRTYRVGMIELPLPGRHKLALGPTGGKARATRISAVSLSPVE